MADEKPKEKMVKLLNVSPIDQKIRIPGGAYKLVRGIRTTYDKDGKNPKTTKGETIELPATLAVKLMKVHPKVWKGA